MIEVNVGKDIKLSYPRDMSITINVADDNAVCHPPAKYILGQFVPEQGGSYVGDIRGDDGIAYGLIVAVRSSAVKSVWGETGTIEGLNNWDGRSNTILMAKHGCMAAQRISLYDYSGHADYYLPAQRELTLALATCPQLFDTDISHWTSTTFGSNYAWAVDFEYGYVDNFGRSREFLARPFRRFIL